MKKKIMVFALVFAIALSAVSAGSIKADLAIGTQNAGMKLNFKDNGNNGLKSTIEAELGGTVDLVFDKNIGMNILLGTDFKQEFKLGAGFLYMTNINQSTVISASIGPYFIFGGGTQMGIYLTADFDFLVGKSFFVRVGTGMDFEFLQFGNGQNATSKINIDIPLPRLALGWKF